MQVSHSHNRELFKSRCKQAPVTAITSYTPFNPGDLGNTKVSSTKIKDNHLIYLLFPYSHFVTTVKRRQAGCSIVRTWSIFTFSALLSTQVLQCEGVVKIQKRYKSINHRCPYTGFTYHERSKVSVLFHIFLRPLNQTSLQIATFAQLNAGLVPPE